jgi:hypothetical protein
VTTTLHGRIGGQYNLALAGEGKYRVQGRSFGNMVTLFTGDYEQATKILDYCVIEDGEAQVAMQHLYFNGDPTKMLELVDHAKASKAARARRRVCVTVEIETDTLEGENAVAIATERLTYACQLAQSRVTLIQGFYSMPDEPGKHADLGRIARQRDLLLDHFIESEDGTFTFPDGATFPCKRKGQPIDENLVHGSMDIRSGISLVGESPSFDTDEHSLEALRPPVTENPE